MKLPKIYAVLNLENPDDAVQFAEFLFSSGITLVQLRDKNKDFDTRLHDTARRILHLRNGKYPAAKVIINDYIEICASIGADGVHLGQTDPSPIQARAILGDTAIIGQSTHSPEQAKSAPHQVLDYLACGPVFHSKTKSGHAPEIGLLGVREIKSVSPLPLVAIGGITLKTANSVLGSGADSVAMVSELRETKSLHEILIKEWLIQ